MTIEPREPFGAPLVDLAIRLNSSLKGEIVPRKYLTTYSVHDSEEDADAALIRAARSLTVKGRGKTHFASKKLVRGVWQVNIYER